MTRSAPTSREVRALVETHRTVVAASRGDAADVLFTCLGSPDPIVRDELALTTLVTWMVEGGLSRATRLRLVRLAIGDDGLLNHLGDEDSESIFQRSFSLALIAAFVATDKVNDDTDSALWNDIVAALHGYAQGELDLRATVPGLGWAHALAHFADVVDECAGHQRCDQTIARALLSDLVKLVGRKTTPFAGEEEDRIAPAIAALLASGHVELSEVTEVIRRAAPEDVVRINWKAIVRSLYFLLPGPADATRCAETQRWLTRVPG